MRRVINLGLLRNQRWKEVRQGRNWRMREGSWTWRRCTGQELSLSSPLTRLKLGWRWIERVNEKANKWNFHVLRCGEFLLAPRKRQSWWNLWWGSWSEKWHLSTDSSASLHCCGNKSTWQPVVNILMKSTREIVNSLNWLFEGRVSLNFVIFNESHWT